MAAATLIAWGFRVNWAAYSSPKLASEAALLITRPAAVDTKSGRWGAIAELPGFTRGLDFVGDYAIVGLSQVRESAVFAGLPLTKRCDERHCGVYIVDIRRRQIVGYVIFSGGVQEIFAVKALPARLRGYSTKALEIRVRLRFLQHFCGHLGRIMLVIHKWRE